MELSWRSRANESRRFPRVSVHRKLWETGRARRFLHLHTTRKNSVVRPQCRSGHRELQPHQILRVVCTPLPKSPPGTLSLAVGPNHGTVVSVVRPFWHHGAMARFESAPSVFLLHGLAG